MNHSRSPAGISSNRPGDIARDADVETIVGTRNLGRSHLIILLVIALVMVIEGYDVFLLANVMPAIARDFGRSPQDLAPVLFTQQLALALGGGLFAPLADRIGRKTILLISLIGFGSTTWLGTFTHDIVSLAATRFVAGFFLAGVLPNAVALITEYAPFKYRATFVTLIFVGFSLGTMMGALFGTRIAAEYGWRMAFLVGAGLPLLICLVTAAALPESIGFRVSRRADDPRIAGMLRRLDPTLRFAGDEHFVVTDRRRTKVSPWELFRDGRKRTTIVLWTAFGLSLISVGLTGYWMPTVLVSKAGLSLAEAGQFNATMSLASICSMLFYGTLIDRFGAKPVLILSYVIGAASLIAIPLIPWDSLVRLALTALVGMTMMAAQSGLNALAASSYPTRIRSTGTAWASVLGRICGLGAPFIGGALVGSSLGFAAVVALFSVPIALTAPVLAFLPKGAGAAERGD